MGDTEHGSWGSNELGGYLRREEARASTIDSPATASHAPAMETLVDSHDYDAREVEDTYHAGIRAGAIALLVIVVTAVVGIAGVLYAIDAAIKSWWPQ